ncbi:MAG TPA: carboxypeptidase-like regulatory domain-containing protein, partial [Chryseosolibacter sp.]
MVTFLFCRFCHRIGKTGRVSAATAALFLTLSTGALAQHLVTGVVRDAETRESLVNATVHLKDTKRYALTDAFGRFTLNRVPAGTAVLEVTYIGYKDAERPLAVDQDVDVEITLEPASVITETVVVRATRATGKTPTTFTTLTEE